MGCSVFLLLFLAGLNLAANDVPVQIDVIYREKEDPHPRDFEFYWLFPAAGAPTVGHVEARADALVQCC